MRLAWLFDVDGTLIHTDGAARESFARAVAEVLGVDDDLAGVAFAGRTDPLIVRDILARHGRPSFQDGEERRFWEAAGEHLRRALLPGRGRVLAGVHELLEAIAREPGWTAGLLTGNRTEMASIKLGHYGLDRRFAFGGFGEQAPDRDALARSLVERVERTYGVPPARCIVVGDTEHDVACARAAGALAVAVASGVRSRADLERHAPDLLLDDLTGWEELIAWGRRTAGD